MWYDLSAKAVTIVQAPANPFANLKVEKRVNKLRYAKEEPKQAPKKITKQTGKSGEKPNYPPDPSTAGYFKVAQTCVSCDATTCHHLIKDELTCRICGYRCKILLVN